MHLRVVAHSLMTKIVVEEKAKGHTVDKFKLDRGPELDCDELKRRVQAELRVQVIIGPSGEHESVHRAEPVKERDKQQAHLHTGHPHHQQEAAQLVSPWVAPPPCLSYPSKTREGERQAPPQQRSEARTDQRQARRQDAHVRGSRWASAGSSTRRSTQPTGS
jgi:hypothetical protein